MCSSIGDTIEPNYFKFCLQLIFIHLINGQHKISIFSTLQSRMFSQCYPLAKAYNIFVIHARIKILPLLNEMFTFKLLMPLIALTSIFFTADNSPRPGKTVNHCKTFLSTSCSCFLLWRGTSLAIEIISVSVVEYTWNNYRPHTIEHCRGIQNTMFSLTQHFLSYATTTNYKSN